MLQGQQAAAQLRRTACAPHRHVGLAGDAVRSRVRLSAHSPADALAALRCLVIVNCLLAARVEYMSQEAAAAIEQAVEPLDV